MIPKKLHLIVTEDDKPYLSGLKEDLAGNNVSVTVVRNGSEIITKSQFSSGYDAVITTVPALLAKYITRNSKPVIDNYAGSLFILPDHECLIIHPLKQLHSVPYGRFIASRYISKITRPQDWLPSPNHTWSILEPKDYRAALKHLDTADLVSVDIETTKSHGIYCVGYCVLTGNTAHSYVLPITSYEEVLMMRELNATAAPKVTQNGKYDLAYMTAYGAPLYNWLFDTATGMHSWYSELPKDLAAVNAFNMREAMYWKDMNDSDDLYEKYHYNAKDTFVTAVSARNMILTMPEWAINNFCQEFPINYPAHHCEMIGLKRDMEELPIARAEFQSKIDTAQASLEACTWAGFNPNSPVQVKKLLRILGIPEPESSDEKHLAKFSLKHPLNKFLLDKILDIRGWRKLVSTYLEPKEFHDVTLYSINPHGTDTGRLASKEHHFWCGLNIQNIPRGKDVKRTLRTFADDWLMGECDYAQAESRHTAYISGDLGLINAVEKSPDFHSQNASAFFGVDFANIYDTKLGKPINKPLRDLAKRVNHGANYNMGPDVLIDTMGEDKVYEARRLLGLPANYTLRQVAEYLLAAFHRAYPDIRGRYYRYVLTAVTGTHKLVGATGWTRYCFGNPQKNKLDLNSYVAHCPQSLNAMCLNKAFLAVWKEVALKHPDTFKLHTQIHDSILFSFKRGHEHHAETVRQIMERESHVSITACTGISYKYYIPADLKMGKDGKGVTHWSMTE